METVTYYVVMKHLPDASWPAAVFHDEMIAAGFVAGAVVKAIGADPLPSFSVEKLVQPKETT